MRPPPAKRKPPEKATDTKKAIKIIIKLLSNYKLKLTATIICAIISSLFSVISLLLIGIATTTIYNGINNIIHHIETIDFNTLFFYLTIAQYYI